VISTAEEFVRLRESEIEAEYQRAAHEPAPVAVWLEVIAKYPTMRSWVALNKTVPLEILEVLAKDSDADVRFTVALKRKLSPELFELLARDPSESVRERIACNAKAPLHVLEKLAKDEVAFVAEAAEKKVRERART
jgi:hypothetical protein